MKKHFFFFLVFSAACLGFAFPKPEGGCRRVPAGGGKETAAGGEELPAGSPVGGSAEVVIELPGNPSTGYSWTWTAVPEGIVRPVLQEFWPQDGSREEGSPRVGAGGVFVFVFAGAAPGETAVIFRYRRSWETGVPDARTEVFRLWVDDKNQVRIIGVPRAGEG
ncbi:MAG: protease inhibitor I42 family protein [Spirochaetales bacterium]|jgi:predicted secreted protein|nr:protease inhibitor I42 family protein [Spirochaetales bacterium]